MDFYAQYASYHVLLLQLHPNYYNIHLIVFLYRRGTVMEKSIRVLESFQIPHNNHPITILVTDLFSDIEITPTIQSNIGIHTDFQVEHMTHCFSKPKSRFIGFFGEEDYSKITEFRFI